MRTGSWLIAVAVGLLVAGCRDDVKDTPNLSAHWPNDDETSWSYVSDVAERQFADLTAYTFHPDSLPPLPTFDEVEAYLDSLPPFDMIRDQVRGSLTLTFSGIGGTLSGVMGQKLVVGGEVDSTIVAKPSPRFLRSLAKARPDLRSRVDGVLDGAQAMNALEPILIHGGIFEKNLDWIGGWGDVDTLLAWKYLEANLSPGATFSHQLVPSLADDVFLHARVEGRAGRETTVGMLSDVLRVTYLVDYGAGISSSGPDAGVIHYVLMGWVDYAPGFGPVTLLERDLIPLGDPTHPGHAHRTLDVGEISFPE